jgi:hypothetical protein
MCWAYRYSLLRHKRKQVTLRSNDLIQKLTEFLEWGRNLGLTTARSKLGAKSALKILMVLKNMLIIGLN